MKKLKIANLNIETECIDKQFFDKRFKEYESNGLIKTDMTLKTIAVDNISKPKGTVIEQIEDSTIVHLLNNKYCRYLTDALTGEITNTTYYNDTYSEVEIHLMKPKQRTYFSLTDLEYAYSGFAFSDRITKLGGVVVHGSSIAFENQGIIFSANSGTGKSTHTNLWRKRFDGKVTIVNDDKPVIRFYDNVPFIFGTPWSGKSDLNANMQVPLKAIIFIKRSKTNSIERLNVRNSIFNLTSQISRPYYDEKIGMRTMESIEKLIQSVKIYRLNCNVSQEAVDVVYKQLIKDGGLLI